MTSTESSSTKQELLEYLLKQGQATAQQLSEALSISRQATQRHLKDLQDEKLVEYQSAPAGIGRPSYVYQLSCQGRARFSHSYDEFAVSVLDTLAETGGEEQVRALLRQQWKRKATEYRQKLGKGSLSKRVAKLVELRQQEGYMAQCQPVENNDSQNKFVLSEHNCAIAKVVKFFPVVCCHELELFAAVLPDCWVERTQWINNGEPCCGYLIQAK